MQVQVEDIARQSELIVSQVETAIVGKRETVRGAVMTLLCGGHLLIEDIPGVGKTTLAKAIAKSMGGDFRRIQFTPDLLPSDITGSSVYNQQTSHFEFRAGPIFGNVVLADEVNRATPKTQSALLEAMEEHQVTVDGETRELPSPFFVIATQNSVEMTGTYPLPEAQMDRFFARISLGYPSRESEATILTRQKDATPIDHVKPVLELSAIRALQEAVRNVFVHDTIRDYVVDVVRATRESGQLLIGSSPRGSLHLMRGAQAHAGMEGLDYVRPDDVKAVAAAILGHRVIPRSEMRSRASIEELIDRIVESVPAPVPVS